MASYTSEILVLNRNDPTWLGIFQNRVETIGLILLLLTCILL